MSGTGLSNAVPSQADLFENSRVCLAASWTEG